MTSHVGQIVRIEHEPSDIERPLGIVLAEDPEEYLIATITRDEQTPDHQEDSVPISGAELISGELRGTAAVRPHKSHWIPKEACRFAGKAKSEFVDKLLRIQSQFFIRTYYDFAHKSKQASFKPGISPVPVSGRVYGVHEMQALMESAFDFWLTAGRFNNAFEEKLARFLGVKHVMTAASGSSANLLALSALTSPKLGDKRLKPGDEVVTVAAAFPTTVNPILQNGFTPVFLDISIPTYNVQPDRIEEAVTEKTRAIVLAHTLGNPFDINEVLRIATKYDLWIIEDCCDALGSKFFLDPSIAAIAHAKGTLVGSFGDIATFSFYPAHHITMGEGGAVATDATQLKGILESFRDWGRDCFCPPGHDNTCGRRFEWQLGTLPRGYDHKYTYSHRGYNLKITEMQAAVGWAQMARLEEFIAVRQVNFDLLRQGLSDLEDHLILPEPTSCSQPSWFGFPVTIRKSCPVNRVDLTRHLQQRKIETRPLFAGNIIRQPYFDQERYRVVGSLENTDFAMKNTFWIGNYPGIGENQIHYMVETIKGYFEK